MNASGKTTSTYINGLNQLDRLSILAKVVTLDVPQDLHAMGVLQPGIESIGRETASAETLLALVLLIQLLIQLFLL